MSVPNQHNFSLWAMLKDNANGNDQHTDDDMKESNGMQCHQHTTDT